jgi:hypothetical protein
MPLQTQKQEFIAHDEKNYRRVTMTPGPDSSPPYLTHLVVERNVAPSTQNQALHALLTLYKQVHLQARAEPWRLGSAQSAG